MSDHEIKVITFVGAVVVMLFLCLIACCIEEARHKAEIKGKDLEIKALKNKIDSIERDCDYKLKVKDHDVTKLLSKIGELEALLVSSSKAPIYPQEKKETTVPKEYWDFSRREK